MAPREREAKEGQSQENSANGNIRTTNPRDLMRDNPAALIVNKEMYDRMAAGFSPDLFDLPQVVKVSTYSSEHGQIIRDFVLDGMTRTKYVNDHEAEISTENPDFIFQVRDVTSAALQNRAIVPPLEKVEGQQALTMVQYLRAVIPPTVEHSQIAPDRIAAHLINGWENMVGESLAKKYSALAALSLLGNPSINIASDELLRKDLARQTRIMSDETADERTRLQNALIEMAAIILQTKLVRQEVARSAFTLVSTESPVIGGGKEARKQMYGLLHTPEVERKLAAAFTNIGEREQMRDQLGQFISDSFKNVAKASNRDEVTSVLQMALKDPTLNYNDVLNVYTSENPIKRYDEAREEINKDRVTRSYQRTYRTYDLTNTETQFIDVFSKRTELSENDINGLIKTIRTVVVTLQRTEDFESQLTGRRNELLTQGVSARMLDEATLQIQAAREAISTSTSLHSINSKIQKALDTANEINRKIDYQKIINKIGGTVDQIAGEQLKEGYGPQRRRDIISLVYGEFGKIDEKNIVQIRQRIQQLAFLDNDLLVRVKSGDFRLNVAIQRQKERKQSVEPKPATVVKPTTERPSVQLTPPIRPSSATIDIGAKPLIPESPREDEVIHKQELEKQRKQINKERLFRLLHNLNEGLNEIDLDFEDLADAEKQPLYQAIRRLGQLAYKQHPDLHRLAIEIYPRLKETYDRFTLAKVEKDIEDAQKDTRTGR